MSLIRMTILLYKALILQREIWCWSLLGFKGFKQRSHLVPGHAARGRYSLSTKVNTPFPQEPTLEFGHGAAGLYSDTTESLSNEDGENAVGIYYQNNN